MKKSELYFYQLLRDFLVDYLLKKRNFSNQTVRSYRQTLNLLRKYCLVKKGIQFEKMDFSCFARENIYDFLMWLKDSRNSSAQTLNLRLSAIKSFLKYSSEEDMELMPFYLKVCSIHAFKGCKKHGVEYLTQAQLKLLFSLPDISTRLGRRNRFFLILAYETGSRMQELLSLKVACIVRNEISILNSPKL